MFEGDATGWASSLRRANSGFYSAVSRGLACRVSPLFLVFVFSIRFKGNRYRYPPQSASPAGTCALRGEKVAGSLVRRLKPTVNKVPSLRDFCLHRQFLSGK